MVLILRVLIGLHLVIIAPTIVRAQGQTYAVLVGVSDYKNLSDKTGDLQFADRDAKQVLAFLRSKIGGNVPAGNIQLLTNQQATRSGIEKAVMSFAKAKSGDRVLFYFSGHGLTDSFAPYDAQSGRVSTMLTHQAIKAAFRHSSASTKLCIIDACLSGSMTQPKQGTPARLSSTNDKGNVAMLLASRSTQYAIESRRLTGGTFTHYLLLGLGGRADRNDDQVVTIHELHQYVAPQVRRATRGRQTPVFYGRFSDNLALTYL